MWDLIVLVPDHCLSFYFDWEKSLPPMSIMKLSQVKIPTSENYPYCLRHFKLKHGESTRRVKQTTVLARAR